MENENWLRWAWGGGERWNYGCVIKAGKSPNISSPHLYIHIYFVRCYYCVYLYECFGCTYVGTQCVYMPGAHGGQQWAPVPL